VIDFAAAGDARNSLLVDATFTATRVIFHVYVQATGDRS